MKKRLIIISIATLLIVALFPLDAFAQLVLEPIEPILEPIEPVKQGIEVIGKRTANSKTFYLGNGIYRMEISSGLLHYKIDYNDPSEEWKDINPHWIGNYVAGAPYELWIEANDLIMRDRRTGDVARLRPEKIGESEATLGNFEIVLGKTGVRLQREVLSASDAMTAEFFVDTPKSGTIAAVASASDAANNAVAIDHTIKDNKLTETVKVPVDTELEALEYPLKVDPSLLLTCTKDTQIVDDYPTNNYGTNSTIKVGNDASGGDDYISRGLLEFEVNWGDLGAATLLGATLYMMTQGGHDSPGVEGGGDTIYAQQLLRLDWTETAATWNQYKSGSNWTTAGAASAGNDYTATDQASESVTASFQFCEWDITDIADTAKTGDDNIALRLKGNTEAGGDLAIFYSAEGSFSPKVYVTYTSTEPALVTNACSGATTTTLQGNAELLDDGGENNIRHGFQYMKGTSGDPEDLIQFSNHSFEIGDPPTSWSDAGGFIPDREDTIIHAGNGTYSIKVTRSTAEGSMRASINSLTDWADWKNETITFGAWVYAPSTNTEKPTIQIRDGVGTTTSAQVPNDDTWHWTTVTRTISGSATSLQLCLRVGDTNNDVMYADGAILINDNELLVEFTDGNYGTGVFNDTLTGLDRNTNYMIRSFSQHTTKIGYGNSVMGITLAEAPTAQTNVASYVGSTSVRLNGTVSDDGGEACEYRFQWGTVSGVYTDDTAWTGAKTSGQTFYEDITGLDPTTQYFFIAEVQNTQGDDEGAEDDFTTLTDLDPPDPFSAIANSGTTITLNWVKGSGSNNTMVRMKQDGYPTSETDGTQVYFSTLSSYTLESLSPGTTYYFRAWGESGGTYSLTYTDEMATTPAGGVTDSPSNTTAPTGWFQVPSTAGITNMPFYAEVNALFDSYSLPNTTGWVMLALLIAALAATGATIMTGGNMWFGLIAGGFVIVVTSWMGLIPLWIMALILIGGGGFAFVRSRV